MLLCGSAGWPGDRRADHRRGVLHWAANVGDPSLTWDDLVLLCEHWHGPIAL